MAAQQGSLKSAFLTELPFLKLLFYKADILSWIIHHRVQTLSIVILQLKSALSKEVQRFISEHFARQFEVAVKLLKILKTFNSWYLGNVHSNFLTVMCY